MNLRRRGLLTLALGQAACTVAPPLLRQGGPGDVERFALGVASGQPQPHGMVLWTALTGAGLPAQTPVHWELAEDEHFIRIAARGTETALAADAHTVHAEPGGLLPARWYWYRFRALGAQSAVGRTRTAPVPGAQVQRLDFAIASCQRWDTGHYAAWRHAASEPLDLVLFLGDYIYEYAGSAQGVRRHEGGLVRTLAGYRQRYAQYKSDPMLQAAHAAAPWLLVWDDHEVDNDYAGLRGARGQPDFAAQRAAAYQAYWEFMPLPQAARPRDGSLRIYGSLDWGALARIHLLDDRQYRDPQACPRPDRTAGSNTVRAAACEALADPRRSLLGAEQERWLADNWSLQQPWNLLAQQTLMARLSTTDPAFGGTYWTDGWDGYAPSRQRLLSTVAQRQVPGVVVLGGDVHAHYVADLHTDFDRPGRVPVATEFCSTSISSLGPSQSRIDAARRFNPHIHHGQSDRRGYIRLALDRHRLQADLRVVDDALHAQSGIGTAARFVVDAAQPGATLA